jgi:hypothetical protein
MSVVLWLWTVEIIRIYLVLLKLVFLYAFKKALVSRKARNDAFPRAVCDRSVKVWVHKQRGHEQEPM